MNLQRKIQRNMTNLYEIPVPFWRQLLDSDLHFHLGHFFNPGTSLEDSMSIAVMGLARQIPTISISRVLDVGCGWGGPSFKLAKFWNAEVVGLTMSKKQASFLDYQARLRNLQVKAKVVNIERYGFNSIGSFDVLWLYEVLEHIVDRRSLFVNLQQAASINTYMAIAMSCRTSSVSRGKLYSEFLGIQHLETASELINILSETGWNVLKVKDCTSLTLPIWALWARKSKQIKERKYSETVRSFAVSIANTEELYKKGMLQSVQILAKRCL